MGKSLVNNLSKSAKRNKIIAVAKDAQEFEDEYDSNVILFEAELSHQEDLGNSVKNIS